MAVEACPCLTGRHHHADFAERFVGVDQQAGRYGEVAVLTCRRCGRLWLRYFRELEAFTASGRWGLGLVSPEAAAAATAESALETLEALESYFIGGSYFGGAIRRVSGPDWLR